MIAQRASGNGIVLRWRFSRGWQAPGALHLGIYSTDVEVPPNFEGEREEK
jgi:hypothetical protein